MSFYSVCVSVCVCVCVCMYGCVCVCVCVLHVRISGTQPDCSPHHKELIDQSRCRAAPLLRAAAETLWSLCWPKGRTAPCSLRASILDARLIH